MSKGECARRKSWLTLLTLRLMSRGEAEVKPGGRRLRSVAKVEAEVGG